MDETTNFISHVSLEMVCFFIFLVFSVKRIESLMIFFLIAFFFVEFTLLKSKFSKFSKFFLSPSAKSSPKKNHCLWATTFLWRKSPSLVMLELVVFFFLVKLFILPKRWLITYMMNLFFKWQWSLGKFSQICQSNVQNHNKSNLI